MNDAQSLRLKDLIELDVELVSDIIGDISSDASDDYMLEAMFNVLKKSLSKYDFETKMPLLGSFEYLVITNQDEAFSILDDNLIQCSELLRKAKSKKLVSLLESWSQKLLKAEETLSNWIYLQDNFQIYANLFDISEYKKLFAKDAIECFQNVDKAMSTVSEILQKSKSILNIVFRGDIHELLLGCLPRIERLIFYADEKVGILRHSFNRFYYLTNKEIIELISCRGVEKLETQLPRLFDNIRRMVVVDVENSTSPVKKVGTKLKNKYVLFSVLLTFLIIDQKMLGETQPR